MNKRRVLEKLLSNWPAKIISLAAAFILFIFFRVSTLEERLFSVPLQVDSPSGLAIAAPYPQSVQVSIRGEAGVVNSFTGSNFRAWVDFGSIRTEDTIRLPVKIERLGAAQRAEPLAVRVDPALITFQLERQIEKTLEVVPNIVGTPEHGYEMVQYNLSPSPVKVRGPYSRLMELKTLNTEPIDLSGRTEDFQATVRINLADPLVQFPGGNTVEFHGVVREAVIIKTFEEVDIITIDLAPHLRLASPLSRGSIKLQGSQIAIERLMPARLRLVVDCSFIEEPGQYNLQPRPDIPPGYIVLRYDPQRTELTVLPVREREAQ